MHAICWYRQPTPLWLSKDASVIAAGGSAHADGRVPLHDGTRSARSPRVSGAGGLLKSRSQMQPPFDTVLNLHTRVFCAGGASPTLCYTLMIYTSMIYMIIICLIFVIGPFTLEPPWAGLLLQPCGTSPAQRWTCTHTQCVLAVQVQRCATNLVPVPVSRIAQWNLPG
jgi:hypothetical protein